MYYPQLVVWGKSATLETMIPKIVDKSSLTAGDIRSVLLNFVSVMREELYNGRSVTVEGFGTFRLSASTTGSDRKEDCGVDSIKSVRIIFRAAVAIRPSLGPSTRAEDRIDFVDLETQLDRLGMTEDGEGGGSTDNDDDDTDTGQGGGSTAGDGSGEDEDIFG